MLIPRHPLAEVLGFPTENFSEEAARHRKNRLCPYNNKVPSCTKDKANDPLGVCSVFEGNALAITCPVRFRQDWIIAEDAARFFFPEDAKWTSLTEIRLDDKHGRSAGNIDIVLVAYDEQGRLTDFGALEVQAVYISGNIRRPFEHYMADPINRHNMDWSERGTYPRPDYLSSSRKRLAPQLIYKGGILKTWQKKQAVALHRLFYEKLPTLPEANARDADIAWLIYDLELNQTEHQYKLVRHRTVYTLFEPALVRITTSEAGSLEQFMEQLQVRLDTKLDDDNPPDAPTLTDVLNL
jgi:hypothetical protein